jgi:hypothetical protein
MPLVGEPPAPPGRGDWYSVKKPGFLEKPGF